MKNNRRLRLIDKILVTIALLLLMTLAIFFGVFIIISRQNPTPDPSPKKQAAIQGEIISQDEETEPKKKKKNTKQTNKKTDITKEPTAPPQAEETQPLEAEATLAPPQAEAAVAPPSPASSTSDIQSQLENLVNTEYAAGGSVAICASRTDGSITASVGDGQMQAASLIKLYVAGCVYENYETIASSEGYSGETEALIRSMITVSDNDSCNTLVARLGGGDAASGMSMVNQYAASHGFSNTHMGRLMLQPNDMDDNYTSVFDCCNFLKKAYAGELAGSSQILGYMQQQERRSKIPAGIPAGVTVGNKTGELSDVENDAAIVYGDNGAYVLCVMSEYLSDTYQAQHFIAKTASVVHTSMQQ